MKKNWISAKAFGLIASTLGFSGTAFLSSCDTDDILCEYGVPTIGYTIKGSVRSQAGTPIEGVRMVVAEGMDTIYTDRNGNFQSDSYMVTGFDVDDLNGVHLQFDDVDGTTNGEYESKKIQLNTFESKQVKEGDDRWFNGDFEFTGEVVLDEKKQ